MTEYQPSTTIFLRPEEFADDAETRLGRANGNIYQRKPGVENTHDGQIMVRLKKKRFIILDYGYIPNAQDFEIAKAVPHINIPNGAGRSMCTTKDCPRVGVPCLLYDSEPNEPMSLYLRGGLCFSCQRNLNEKRRTQRKRKSDGLPVGEIRACSESVGSGSATLASSRFRFNDQIIDLNPDAVVINGPVDGTRVRGPDYQCSEIGSDLLRIVSELSHETLSLLQHSSAATGMAQPVATASSVDALYQRAFLSVSRATFLLAQWKASWDESQAFAARMAQGSLPGLHPGLQGSMSYSAEAAGSMASYHHPGFLTSAEAAAAQQNDSDVLQQAAFASASLGDSEDPHVAI